MMIPNSPRDPGPKKGAEASRRASGEPRPLLEGQKKRIYIVDDHVMMRQGLSVLLNGTAGLEVCGEAGSAEDALQDIPRQKPDIAIIDLSLEGTSGLELIKNLHSRQQALPLLVLSMHDESFFAERVLRAGASGYVMKHRAVQELREAILRVLAGGLYVSQDMSDRLLRVMARGGHSERGSGMDLLSDREVEVFELIGRGQGNSEIALRLHLSIKTIETYRARIKEKLELKDAAELFQHALNWVQEGPGASPRGNVRGTPE
jgi:DNA-binding NarL/FixJ family response regulator